jgi:hypothetical protein
VRRGSRPRITPSSHHVAVPRGSTKRQYWTIHTGNASGMDTNGQRAWIASTEAREEFPTNHPNPSSTSPYLPHGSLLSHTLQWERPVRAWAVSMDENGMDNYSSMDGMKLVMTPVSNSNHAHGQLKTGPGHVMDIQPRHYRTRKRGREPIYWKTGDDPSRWTGRSAVSARGHDTICWIHLRRLTDTAC